ncbi:MAG TPA: DUF4266 domain-containing protein [Burkholderiaceae bacterium]|nr:DUF4266 domain-containing protein [Burkholderiaceae bacterium]HSC00667.1 DUF4266 domain-containing protein [Burkholderiaceae bacterium]
MELSCLAKGRGNGPGAACKARQRPGKAGSAAAAWLLCAGTLAFAGCSPIEPWVKPYERERLADPIMQLQRQALAAKNSEHIHEVREGARGANGVQGGGCGCN